MTDNIMYYVMFFIGVVILNIGLSYTFGKVINKEVNVSIGKFIVTISLFAMLLVINNHAIQSFMRTIVFFIFSVINFKILFQEHWPKTIMATFSVFVIYTLAEITFGIIALIINLPTSILTESIYSQLIVNSIISIIIVLIMLGIRKITKKELVLFGKNEDRVNYVFIISSLISISYLMFRNFNNGVYDSKVWLDYLIIFALCFGVFLIVKEKMQRASLSKEYDSLQEYIKSTESVLENYRKSNHENKNQLVAIHSMVEKKDKNAAKYIEALINEKMPKDVEIINNLVNISSEGLKGLMYHKIAKMQQNGIKVKINIAKAGKKKLSSLPVTIAKDYFKLIGVYLDNAYDAALESKTKEVIIEGYFTEEVRSLVITNTFSNKIDLTNIDNAGVTTKSKNHGYGLALAKDILSKNEAFEQKREVDGKYYSQYIDVYPNKQK